MHSFWNYSLFHNTVLTWTTAIAFFGGGVVLTLIFKKIILKQLQRWALRTDNTLDDFIVRTFEEAIIPLAYLAALYVSIQTLTLSTKADRVLYVLFLFLVTFYLLRVITALVRQFIFSFIQKQEDSETKAKQARGLLIIINVVIWVLGVVFLIDNLGYNVTTLVTGLGIGGIAIALAAQTILGDLFSYFIIFFDRPFEIGDFIIVDDKMGTVEYIGVKTTRLRTLNGEQLVCSNTFLTNARVHNYKRMQERRVVFKLSVVYQTPTSRVRRVPGIVRGIIESKRDVRFDRGHFQNFSPSSLDFEFVYYILSPDYNVYMDRHQEIALDILAAFERERIAFAYPTQTLYVSRQDKHDTADNEDLDTPSGRG